MIRFKNFIVYAFALFTLVACEQDIPCLPPRAEISNIAAVFVGQTLQLQAPDVADATYSWTGPNNFSSTEQNPSIPNVTAAASGTYEVTVKVGECENKASKEIQIMQSASCSPANNTFSFGGSMVFTLINGTDNTEEYKIVGHSNQGGFTLTFYTNPFRKGNFVYQFSTQDRNTSNVFMQIDKAFSNWQAVSGKLYVTVNNGVLTATFCTVPFGWLQGSSNQNGSGKFTCTQ